MSFNRWVRGISAPIPNPLPVSFPTPVLVSGTFWQPTQNVNITEYLSAAVGPLNPMDVKVSNFPAFPALQNVNITEYLSAAVGPLNPMDVKISNFPATYDVSDRAARLLGIIYGNLGQLDQILLGGRNLATVDVQAWLGSQAPTVGQKAMAASLPVVIASDQGPVPTTQAAPSAVGTLADLTGNSAAQQLIAGSTPCKAVIVRALAANTTVVRVGDGNVSASRGVELSAGDALLIPISNVNLVYFYGVSPAKVSILYVN